MEPNNPPEGAGAEVDVDPNRPPVGAGAACVPELRETREIFRDEVKRAGSRQDCDQVTN